MRAVELEGDAAVPVARLLLALAWSFETNNAAAGQRGCADVDDEGFGDAAGSGRGGGLDHQAAQLGFHGGFGSFVGAECQGDFVVAFGSVEAEEEGVAADAGGFHGRSIAFKAESPAR